MTVRASLADLGAWPWAGYATSEAKLTQERGKVKRWTRAMVRSLQLMLTNREETIRIAMREFKHPRDVAESASAVSVRAIDPQVARRRTEHGSGLGKYRWPVERFFAWLHGYRRLRLRTDWDTRMHNAFLNLALGIICFGFL